MLSAQILLVSLNVLSCSLDSKIDSVRIGRHLNTQCVKENVNNENACSPFLYIYVPLAESDPAALIKDADNDGVVDSLDQEPNSDPLASVDIHGVALDSDGDGCLDHLDPEVHTSPVLPIENCANVKIGCTWDFGIDICRRPGNKENDWILPWIFFDAEKAEIRSDAIPALNQIVEIYTRYPSLKLQVIIVSVENEVPETDLGVLRAVNATNFIVAQGVSESRITIVFDSYRKNNIDCIIQDIECDNFLHRVEFKLVAE